MPRYNSRGDAANTFKGGVGIDGNRFATGGKDSFTWMDKEHREYAKAMYEGGLKQPKIDCDYTEPHANLRDLVEAAIGWTGTPYDLGGRNTSKTRGVSYRNGADDTPTDGGRYHPRGFGGGEH